MQVGRNLSQRVERLRWLDAVLREDLFIVPEALDVEFEWKDRERGTIDILGDRDRSRNELIKNTEFHAKCCSKKPPITGPMPEPSANNPAQMAIACARS